MTSRQPLNYDTGIPSPEQRELRSGTSPVFSGICSVVGAIFAGIHLDERGRMHWGEAELTVVLLWFSLVSAVVTVVKVRRRRGPYYRWSRRFGIGLMVPWGLYFLGNLTRFFLQIDRWRWW